MLRAAPTRKRWMRTKVLGTATAAVLAIALAALPASAVTRNVEISDDVFTPSSLSARVGDTVHWFRAAGSDGDHNVREEDNATPIFRSGIRPTVPSTSPGSSPQAPSTTSARYTDPTWTGSSAFR